MKFPALKLLVAGICLWSAGASAQRMERYVDKMGLVIALGGGVQDFTESTARETTGFGGTWDVRVIGGTNMLIGGELAYVGSAQSIDAVGIDTDADLIANGLEGAVRVNILRGRLQPYGLAGVGWRNYNLSSDLNTSDIADDDNVFEIPLAAGVAYSIGHLMLDTRFTFRPTFADDLVPDGRLHTWSLTGRAGYRF